MIFSDVSNYFQKIEKTSSRLEMAQILYQLFKDAKDEEISSLIYFCQGKVGPKYKGKEINIGTSTLLSLVSRYLGQNLKTVKENFYKFGDVGLVIENLKSKKQQKTLFSKQLTFLDVYETFEKMSLVDGKGAVENKIKLFESVLYYSDVFSAKYILRFPISLRLGFSDSTIIDALSLMEEDESLRKEVRDLILEKYNLVSDLGLIAKEFKEKGVEGINNLTIKPFIPIKPALCERSKDFEEIHERLSKENNLFCVDTKVDGFRMQIHKFKSKVVIFSRNEEEITDMFPDIVLKVSKIPYDFIIDSEAIAYDSENKKYYNFQITMQRKRKYNILEKSKELPLHLKIFDIVYFKDKTIYDKSFKDRREILENNFNLSEEISLTKIKYTKDIEELKLFFKESLEKGFEGIIAKSLDSKYTAGSRGFNWIKYKKSYDKDKLDNIDVVILGMFYGQGKRTQTGLGALLVGLYDENTNKYYTIAKIGSGLKDDILKELSIKLKPYVQEIKPNNLVSNLIPDVYLLPKIVIEVNYDDITISSQHTTPLENTDKKLALRFPRFIKYRFDRDEKNTTSIKEISRIYSLQKTI